MSTAKKQGLKIQQILTDIQSGNAAKITTGLKQLQANGDISVIEPLVAVLVQPLPQHSREEILTFLGDLKVSEAIPVIMELVKEDCYHNIRQQLLSTIWNSKLDFSAYLADFVEIACEGTFMEALECLTILENLEGPFMEQQFLESQLHLRDYIEDKTPKDEQKAHILSEIALFIKDLNESDYDDIDLYNE